MATLRLPCRASRYQTQLRGRIAVIIIVLEEYLPEVYLFRGLSFYRISYLRNIYLLLILLRS